MTPTKRAMLLLLITVVGALVLMMTYGCAATRVVTAPSTKPLQEDLGRAQTHITESKTLAQRIHDKDVLVDRWYETHRK